MSTVLGIPERPIIRLDQRYADHLVHGLRIILTWGARGQRQPCMVILNPMIPLASAIPCIIPCRNAWLWTEEYGDPAAAFESVVSFAPALGLSPHSKADCFRIMDAVRSRISDLLMMPPAPRRDLKIAGEMAIRVGGPDGTLVQKELRDDV